MSDESSSPPNSGSSSSGRRRASFSPGQALSDLFGRSSSQSNGSTSGTPAYPGPIATAAASVQAQQRRRLSISSLGLSGNSPTQSSPVATGRPRRESFSSAGSGSPGIDENAIEEGDAITSGSPSTAFGRRVSFGARALRDVRKGSGNVNGEGFNWSESLRSRAERTSISGPSNGVGAPTQSTHQRATSVATMEPPAQEMPKARKAPDPFQERILKGDFYMD